jgi:hypothetical protein
MERRIRMGRTEIEAHLLSNVYLLRNNDLLSVYALLARLEGVPFKKQSICRDGLETARTNT